MQDYLRPCLDSALSSPASDYEVVAVNDGSTDSSGKILQEYAKDFGGKLRIVSKENGGLGSARNAGMEVCRGEFVVFLDSDDFLAQGAVDEILSECEKNDFDILFFDQEYISGSGKSLMRFKGSNREGSFSFEEFPQILFSTPNAGNKIFRKRLFDESGISFPPRQWFEDVNSVYMLYPHCREMRYVSKAWNVHLQRSGSITNSGNAKRNLEMIDACSELLAYYKKLGIFEKYSEELEYCLFYNEFLTSIDRVNLIDYKSPVQDELKGAFVSGFPNYKENDYIKTMPRSHRLLTALISGGHYRLLNAVLKLNALRHRG